MREPAIVLVGGGSSSWGPGVLASLLANQHLEGCHVVLHDLDATALDKNHRLAGLLREQAGSATTFRATTDPDRALDGADYVVVTISTGALEAMAVDLEVPERYGIFQTVGDTVGPGGLSRTLRNVPVFVDLARRMEARCPRAWMLNCSNPLSALTRVVTRETSIRAVGLCHGVRNVVRRFAAFFGVPFERCHYANSGIDHCAWLTHLSVDGEDGWARLRRMGVEAWLEQSPEAARQDATFGDLYTLRCGLLLGRQLGALPGIDDRHLVEFFPGFLQGEANAARHGLTRTSIADRRANYERAEARRERLLRGDEEAERVEPASDDVGAWIAALDGGPAVEDNLNAPNIGQVPQLPAGAVVETRGVLDTTGYRPLASPLPPQLEAVVRPHALREELALEAGLEGSFEKALAALTTDPLLVRPEDARPLLTELVAGTKRWLPQWGQGARRVR